MGQCKNCGHSGWFLSISELGLCNDCHGFISSDISNRSRIISESAKIIAKSKKLDVQLSRYDLMIEQLEALKQYEEKGIPTVDEPPSKWLQECKKRKDEFIYEGLKLELKDAQNKTEITTSMTAKINQLSKVLVKIREYKDKIKNPSDLNLLEKTASDFIHKIQLNSYLDAANKAEFKRQPKKALDQYYEALYFLKHDDIDDSFQKEHISNIEQKIAELGGDKTT